MGFHENQETEKTLLDLDPSRTLLKTGKSMMGRRGNKLETRKAQTSSSFS
jgi:hypothetical protein